MKEYDDRGKLVYSIDSSGFEESTEYNKNNNKIHYKNSIGTKRCYNIKGAKIPEKEYIISILIKWKQESNERV